MIRKEKNIFEGAKFGDPFVTRNGITGVLLYHHGHKYTLYLEYESALEVNEDGSYELGDEHPNDIVSKYHKEIDEEKLEELALQKYPICTDDEDSFLSWNTVNELQREAYKSGYRKER